VCGCELVFGLCCGGGGEGFISAVLLLIVLWEGGTILFGVNGLKSGKCPLAFPLLKRGGRGDGVWTHLLSLRIGTGSCSRPPWRVGKKERKRGDIWCILIVKKKALLCFANLQREDGDTVTLAAGEEEKSLLPRCQRKKKGPRW